MSIVCSVDYPELISFSGNHLCATFLCFEPHNKIPSTCIFGELTAKNNSKPKHIKLELPARLNRVSWILGRHIVNTSVTHISVLCHQMDTRWCKTPKSRLHFTFYNLMLFKNHPPSSLHEWCNFLSVIIMKLHTIFEYMFCLCKTKTEREHLRHVD